MVDPFFNIVSKCFFFDFILLPRKKWDPVLLYLFDNLQDFSFLSFYLSFFNVYFKKIIKAIIQPRLHFWVEFNAFYKSCENTNKVWRY